MITSKERMVSGKHDNISSTNGSESVFSCSDTKKLGEGRFQFISSNLHQQPEIEVPLCMQFNEKNCPDYGIKCYREEWGVCSAH